MDLLLPLQIRLLHLPPHPLALLHFRRRTHRRLRLRVRQNPNTRQTPDHLRPQGFLYISTIWHLACVISVLEDSYGKEAIIKSMRLIKGKTGTAIVMSSLAFLCFLGIQLGFESFVVIGLGGNGGVRIGVAIVCLMFLVKVILFGVVQQTVLYFVCKSYHHENVVDKASLEEDHLEVYLGEYVSLKDRDVQLPGIQV
ncbi:polyadenylate-binding protein 1-B-binding protein [Senna tora]|uniref:Polyadenylate-binding protein 1-B-binding protein n=1 Tax=Senna tora TaxID=362788 RepID=A0A834X8F1_9FABA|nr:polyadenylate-binding protein 1-B-binding protein [Senna tora]